VQEPYLELVGDHGDGHGGDASARAGCQAGWPLATAKRA
jgi:hypothetical protein